MKTQGIVEIHPIVAEIFQSVLKEWTGLSCVFSTAKNINRLLTASCWFGLWAPCSVHGTHWYYAVGKSSIVHTLIRFCSRVNFPAALLI